MNYKNSKRVRAVVIRDHEILLMHRIKEGSEDYSFPGGAIEAGEDPEDAVVREAKEESGLDIKVEKFLLEAVDELGAIQNYFLCSTSDNHNPKIQKDSPEDQRQSKNNIYDPQWIALDKLPYLDLIPKDIKNKIIELYERKS